MVTWLVQVGMELLVCAVHPIPGEFYFLWTTKLSNHGGKIGSQATTAQFPKHNLLHYFVTGNRSTMFRSAQFNANLRKVAKFFKMYKDAGHLLLILTYEHNLEERQFFESGF